MPKRPRPSDPIHHPSDLRPIASVDLAVFTVAEDCLRVLLARSRTTAAKDEAWALPGADIVTASDGDLRACARRTAVALLGKAPPYMEQLGSWGSADRDPRGWAATHVYLVPVPVAWQPVGTPAPGYSAWHPIRDSAPGVRLAMDHAQILAAAIARLRNKAEYTSLVAQMLPEEFTLPDLQHAYEVVLERPMDKSAFRKRMLSGDLLEPLDRTREGLRRPAKLYRLRNRRSVVYFPRPLQVKS